MINATADTYVFLLSTDWFEPYWPSLGLLVSAPLRTAIKGSLREEVRRFVGRAYWDAPFTEDRVASTQLALMNAFQPTSDETMAVLSSLVGRQTSQSDSRHDSWLLLTLTTNLVEELPADLSKEAHVAAVDAWADSHSSLPDWQQRSESSTSDWDAIVRQLTPDQPDWLPNFLSVEVTAFDAFGVYWARLTDSASATLIEELSAWYGRNSLRLVAEEVRPPV